MRIHAHPLRLGRDDPGHQVAGRSQVALAGPHDGHASQGVVPIRGVGDGRDSPIAAAGRRGAPGVGRFGGTQRRSPDPACPRPWREVGVLRPRPVLPHAHGGFASGTQGPLRHRPPRGSPRQSWTATLAGTRIRSSPRASSTSASAPASMSRSRPGRGACRCVRPGSCRRSRWLPGPRPRRLPDRRPGLRRRDLGECPGLVGLVLDVGHLHRPGRRDGVGEPPESDLLLGDARRSWDRESLPPAAPAGRPPLSSPPRAPLLATGRPASRH